MNLDSVLISGLEVRQNCSVRKYSSRCENVTNSNKRKHAAASVHVITLHNNDNNKNLNPLLQSRSLHLGKYCLILRYSIARISQKTRNTVS